MPRLSMSAYARTLRVRGLRRVLVLGVILRAPAFAAAVVLTVHCVVHLGVSYTQAGVLTAAATLATTISGPWRGHLVDQYGSQFFGGEFFYSCRVQYYGKRSSVSNCKSIQIWVLSDVYVYGRHL
jgi:hypothetical protein